jgi:hypothetical protein
MTSRQQLNVWPAGYSVASASIIGGGKGVMGGMNNNNRDGVIMKYEEKLRKKIEAAAKDPKVATEIAQRIAEREEEEKRLTRALESSANQAQAEATLSPPTTGVQKLLLSDFLNVEALARNSGERIQLMWNAYNLHHEHVSAVLDEEKTNLLLERAAACPVVCALLPFFFNFNDLSFFFFYLSSCFLRSSSSFFFL